MSISDCTLQAGGRLEVKFYQDTPDPVSKISNLEAKLKAEKTESESVKRELQKAGGGSTAGKDSRSGTCRKKEWEFKPEDRFGERGSGNNLGGQ